MMLGRMSMKVRPVVREKVVDAPIWRMFHPDFKGKVEVLACADGEGGFNFTIRDNFRLPDRKAMEAELRKANEILGPWKTLMPQVFPSSTWRSMVTSSSVNPKNRMSRLLFLLWCRKWQVVMRLRVDLLRVLNLLMRRNGKRMSLLPVGRKVRS
ncbi:hypothetical protein HanIR_Chr06g0283771 [Helianthus annuus]|nr:hypothetical protein HanIR_Chr06g0283771 [Helianthus annuus]